MEKYSSSFLQIAPPLNTGGESSSYMAETSIGEAYINGLYDGISFSSLLTYNPENNNTESLNLFTVPKIETQKSPFHLYDAVSPLPAPYDFLSSADQHHHQLPDLLSYEISKNPSYDSNPPLKTAPYAASHHHHQKRHLRKRCQRLGDQTRRLQNLLPLDQKMDMATVLEESYKYIKFLKAQVSILQCMPPTTIVSGGEIFLAGTTHYSTSASTTGDFAGDLCLLNRQQLLQMLLNSPVAQTVMYSRGCCVYSVEQVLAMKRNAERKAVLLQNMMNFGNSDANSFIYH